MKTTTKTILFPTDFSLDSMNAIDLAIDICEKSKCRLALLNVIDAPFSFMTEDDDTELDLITSDLMSISNFNLDKLKVKIEAKHKIEVVFATYVGDMATAVSRAVENFSAYKVIMGTKIIDDLFFKSNTFEILKTISVPLLTLSINSKTKFLSTILLAINNNGLATQKLDEVIEIAKLYKSKIILLGVSQNESEEKTTSIVKHIDEIKNYLESNKLECEVHTKSNEKFSEEVLNFNKSIEFDLIVFADFLPDNPKLEDKNKDVKNIINNSDIPVLTIPSRN